MNSYTPLSLEAERLLKIASNLDDNLKEMPIKVIRDSRGNDWLIDVSPDDTAKYIALKQLVKDAFNNAENAFKAVEADLKQRNYAQILRTHLEEQDIYISTYPHTHHKRGMFYAAVVQCFSQVYYSYYEWQGDDTYKWETAEAIHHTEFERTKKELSHATYEQALERAFDIAFGLIRDNLNNE